LRLSRLLSDSFLPLFNEWATRIVYPPCTTYLKQLTNTLPRVISGFCHGVHETFKWGKLHSFKGTESYRGSRSIALLIHDHSTRRGWGVRVTHRPLLTPRKDRVPIVQEVGWAPWSVWTSAENIAPQEFDPRTVQPVASRYTDWATRPTHGIFAVLIFSQRRLVFFTEVLGQPIGLFLNGQAVFENGTDRLSRNVGDKLPIYVA
jgi:hypothetical protein